MSYGACWAEAARGLLPQALAGEPQFVEAAPGPAPNEAFGYVARVGGEWQGRFWVLVDATVLETPLLGEGVDQREAWSELLREVAEAAAGSLCASQGAQCRIEAFVPCAAGGEPSRGFELRTQSGSWRIVVRDEVVAAGAVEQPQSGADAGEAAGRTHGLELLLDVELEASLRFGSREMVLGEILDLGPGDVVQLDRQVSDPVDLLVGDKIVARGEVVLVNGNFGLRVTEVAEPRKRLESVRCLF